jgi:hypothetical protein
MCDIQSRDFMDIKEIISLAREKKKLLKPSAAEA